jgi:ATP-dependent DNA ligase
MIYPPQPSQISTHSLQFRKVETDPSWVAEPCVLGLRCLAYRHHCRIDLWTKGRKPITAPLVEIQSQIMSIIPDDTILDGILFAGMGRKYDHYFVFDIPLFRNKETGDLFERHHLLNLLKYQPNIITPDHQPETNKLVLLHESRKILGYKGIIIKDLSSIYPKTTKSKSITSSWLAITT